MLVKFTDGSGAPVYVSPQYVIAVRQQKHFGRPGVASDTEYHDTLIVTTRHDINVQEAPEDVARELDRAAQETGSGTAPAT